MADTKKKSKFRVEYGAEVENKYKWTQTKEEVQITIPLGASGLRGRDIACTMKSKKLQFGLKGKPLIIDGELTQAIDVDASTWIIEGSNVEMTLTKGTTSSTWWSRVIVGEGPEVDTQKIEGSQYVDQSLLERLEREQQEVEEREAQQAKDDVPPLEEDK